MTHFLTERLLKVEGAPENIDLQGVRQKIPGHWKKLGRRLIEKDEEALHAIEKEVIQYYEKASKILLT